LLLSQSWLANHFWKQLLLAFSQKCLLPEEPFVGISGI
jgi:hypothetical protein